MTGKAKRVSRQAAGRFVSAVAPRCSVTYAAGMFRTGYILSAKADSVWFLGLPFAAVAMALGFQAWLPYVAVASINLWVTTPHHYATWVRSYGMPDVWQRFRARLIVGPVAIFSLTAAGLIWAPITLLLLVSAWDHQHSIMQQHGFSRVYDFKARTGLENTRKFDLALHWILYGNMFVQAPMFRSLWIRELHRMDVPVTAGFVEVLTTLSWIVAGGYVVVYALHLRTTVRAGSPINPVKYGFIGASYFLWYFVAWHTNSILLYAVAHRVMHGVQYIVMVYAFMQRSAATRSSRPGFWSRVAGTGRLRWFLILGGAYAVIFQLLINRPLDEFGFGVVNFAPYPALPQFNIPALDYAGGYELWSQMMLYAYALLHYYVDSFIWKVRDKQVQGGL